MIKVSVIIPAYQRVIQTIKTVNLVLSSTGLNKEFVLEIIVANSSFR